MSLTYVGGTTGSGTSAAYNVDLSGISIAEGDIVVVATGMVSTTDLNPGISSPVDYTELVELYADDGRDANLAICYKVQGPTPDTSITCTGTGSSTNSAVTAVHVWRGVDTTNPIDVTITTATGINTGTFDSPSTSPTTTGAIVLSLGLGTSLNARTAPVCPTGYGNQVNESTDPGNAACVGIASKAWSGSGSEDPGAWSNLSISSNDSWAAATLVLRPASGGETTSNGDPISYSVTASSGSADVVVNGQVTSFAMTFADAAGNLAIASSGDALSYAATFSDADGTVTTVGVIESNGDPVSYSVSFADGDGAVVKAVETTIGAAGPVSRRAKIFIELNGKRIWFENNLDAIAFLEAQASIIKADKAEVSKAIVVRNGKPVVKAKQPVIDAQSNSKEVQSKIVSLNRILQAQFDKIRHSVIMQHIIFTEDEEIALLL